LEQVRDHFDLKAKREAERQKKERAVLNDHVASGLEDVRLIDEIFATSCTPCT